MCVCIYIYISISYIYILFLEICTRTCHVSCLWEGELITGPQWWEEGIWPYSYFALFEFEPQYLFVADCIFWKQMLRRSLGSKLFIKNQHLWKEEKEARLGRGTSPSVIWAWQNLINVLLRFTLCLAKRYLHKFKKSKEFCKAFS